MLRGTQLSFVTLLRSLAPGGWWWLLRCSINGTLSQLSHRFCHCSFKLWIAALYYILRPVLDIDVGRDAFVLNRPVTVARKEPAAGCDHRSAVNKRWRVSRMDQPTPGALTHQQPKLA